jgi:hypothetical protein
MTTIETRRYEMLVRVRDFGNARGDLFPESTLARKQFTTVSGAVKELSEYAVKKMAAKQEGKRTKAIAREALLDRLESMAITARAIARDTPGLEDRFHVPRRRSDQDLLTTGRLFARDAEALKDQFLAHAMRDTFVADLIDSVETFEQAIHDREAGKGEQTAARASMNATLASGTAAVQKLDAMVRNHLRGDPETTALWRSVRRIGHARRPPRVAAASPPAPYAPTPASRESTPPAAVTPPQTTSLSVTEKAS